MFLGQEVGSERGDLVHSRLVGVQFLFEVLMLLNLAVQVSRVQVRVVRSEFQFLVDPSYGLQSLYI